MLLVRVIMSGRDKGGGGRGVCLQKYLSSGRRITVSPVTCDWGGRAAQVDDHRKTKMLIKILILAGLVLLVRWFTKVPI